MKGKHAKKKEWNRTVRRMLSIIPVLVVALSVYTMSALAWFSSSIMEKTMEIASGQYVSQVEIVKNYDGLMNDENLIGKPYQTSSFLNESVDLSNLEGTQTAYIIVSNFKENTTEPGTIADVPDDSSGANNIPFQYELELKAGNTKLDIERMDSSEGIQSQNDSTSMMKCESLEPGKKDIYKVTLPAGQDAGLQDAKLQLRTAFTGSTIHTASSLADLQKEYKPGSVVYLTGNIEAPDAELVFKGSYPNLVLNGYLLHVKNLMVDAEPDLYSTMDISDGMLQIGDKVYSDEDTIQSEGQGHITVNLLNLGTEHQESIADPEETNDAEVLDQPESPQNEEQQQPASPSKRPSTSTSSAPSKEQGSTASKPTQKPKPPASSSSAAASSSASNTEPSSIPASSSQGSSSSKPASGNNTVSTPPVEPDRAGQQDTAIVDEVAKDK
nr:hypothetical protein [uncultured Solibaculum sp.]